jgi:DNA-binding response OmpR family regulator
MSSSDAQLPQLEPLSAASPEGNAARAVLLVEDEESLAELLAHLLSRLQLRVIRASDGAGGLQLFLQHQVTVALAFVDCRLPDMDGAEVCRQLRQIQPKLPLLLTSGRDHRALAAGFGATAPAAFLAKPYMPADVTRHVTALLSAVG